MTSFGWKRKAGDKVSAKISKDFEDNAKDENVNAVTDDIDWQIPKKRAISLEDAASKAQRLCQEGSTLAESERFWEAIKKWDEALQLEPNNARLYEMKSQAYSHVGELFPSLHAAEKAVELDRQWWVAYQTLGRSQLGVGEVKLAARSFCKAVHLNPSESELWEEDIAWVKDLLQQKQASLEQENILRDKDKQESVQLIELGCEDISKELVPSDSNGSSSYYGCSDPWEDRHDDKSLQKLPKNYVYMRN